MCRCICVCTYIYIYIYIYILTLSANSLKEMSPIRARKGKPTGAPESISEEGVGRLSCGCPFFKCFNSIFWQHSDEIPVKFL